MVTPAEERVPHDLALGCLSDDLNEAVDVRFVTPNGATMVVPAFQAGDGSIRVRFAAPHSGVYDYVTTSRHRELDGLQGRLTVRPYGGKNPLYRHGRLQVAPDGRTLAHADGTPFLWLGDTWWMGLCARLRWPDEFGMLLADRVEKGFSVVQVVAGPLPDFGATPDGIWHPQQANEGGWPWDPGWERLNPRYYDRADQRIAALVDAGIVPCIVGMWGFYLSVMGVERIRRHWRNLVARYAAYPVVFCVAGEVNYTGYDRSKGLDTQTSRRLDQIRGWSEIIHEVKRIDPFGNLVTAHPAHPDSRSSLSDPSGLDVNLLQTSHWSYHQPAPEVTRELTEVLGLEQPIRLGFEGAIAITTEAIARVPTMPVINAEPCYEGIMGGNWQDVQRFLYWSGMLSGLAGFTYGADGIWQMASDREAFSNTVSRWGTVTWRAAMDYPGSRQVGLGRTFLEQFEWWSFRPVAGDQATQAGRLNPFGAANDHTAIYYLPSLLIDARMRGMRGLPIDVPADLESEARFVDPRTLRQYQIGPVRRGADGKWAQPDPPSNEDWLLVIERGSGENQEST